MPRVPKTISLQCLCNISRKTGKDKFDLLPTDNRQRFLQIAVIILGVCVARHAQITQSNKFAISLEYLKKELSDEVDFFTHR